PTSTLAVAGSFHIQKPTSLDSSFIVTSAGNVGVGTTNPGAKLDVNGSIYANNIYGPTDFQIGWGGVNKWVFHGSLGFFAPANDNQYDIGWSTARIRTGYFGTSLNVGTGATPETVISSTSNSYFGGNVGIGLPAPTSTLAVAGSFHIQKPTSLDSSFIVTSAGNVGVGTTTPGQKLEVNGNLQIDTAAGNRTFVIENSGASAALIRNTGFIVVQGGSGAGLAFNYNGGTEGMRIDNAGNVGIGTTNPLAKLQVETSGASDVNVATFRNIGAQGAASISIRTDTSGQANSRNWSLITNSGAFGNFDILHSTTNTGDPSTSALTINNGGNVGIGTTGPGANLDVNGVVRIGASSGADLGNSLEVWSTAYPTLSLANNTNGIGQGVGVAFRQLTTTAGVWRVGGNIQSIASGTYTLNTGSTYNSDLAFFTAYQAADVERMRILSNGNVGIGTTAPGSKLSVQGTLAGVAGGTVYGVYISPTLVEAGSGNHAEISGMAIDPVWTAGAGTSGRTTSLSVYGSAVPSGTTDAMTLYVGSPMTNATNNYALYSVSGTNYFGGNVGIGTTNPGRKLEVSDTTHVYVRTITNATTLDAGFESRDGTNIVYSGLMNGSGCGAGNWAVYAGACRMVIQNSNGNVGIGTTNPNAKLQVHDGTNINLYIREATPWNMAGIALQSYNDANNAYTPLTFAASAYNFYTGNVGIGTTNPDNGKLLIEGAAIGSLSNLMLVNTHNATSDTAELNFATYGGNHVATAAIKAINRNDLALAATDLAFSAYSGGSLGEIMRIRGNQGWVGIMNTAPTSTLSVVGSVAVQAATSYDRTFAINTSGNVSLRTLAGAAADHLCYDTTTVAGLYTLSSCSSSLRYKEDVTDLSVSFAKDQLYSLRPVSFKWKNRNQRGVGFIAEEVAQTYPDMVTYNRDGQIEGINYDQFSAYLLLAIKDVDTRFTSFVSNNGQWGLDADGYMVIDKLKTSELAIKGNKTVGSARIRSGDMGITINTTAVSANSLIQLTFLGDLAGRTWYVSERTPGEHFTIKLSGNLSSDIDFQWWIVGADAAGEMQYSSSPVIPAEAGIQSLNSSTSPGLPATLPTPGEGNTGSVAGTSTTTAETTTTDPNTTTPDSPSVIPGVDPGSSLDSGSQAGMTSGGEATATP
ncbi:tail fiber domain-containing protein, partial [bacterium]